MKPDRIKISHEFPGLWLAVEIPIAPDENVIDEFKKGKSLLVEAYGELAEPNLVPISEALGITQVDKRIETIIADINECTAIDSKTGLGVQIGLIAYRDAADSDPRILAAYDLKMIQLKQKL